MGITIAVLAILAIIGSIMWLMPSREQQRQALLRQKAYTCGLKVELVNNINAFTLDHIKSTKRFASYNLVAVLENHEHSDDVVNSLREQVQHLKKEECWLLFRAFPGKQKSWRLARRLDWNSMKIGEKAVSRLGRCPPYF